MADNKLISKVILGGVTYDLKDKYAREKLLSFEGLVAGGIQIEVVNELPAASRNTVGKIYFISHTHSESEKDIYDEYLTIVGGTEETPTYSWEKIGNTDIDLSGYAKKTDIPTTLPANGGNADTVNGHSVDANVPSDAKFTDTTYDVATSSTPGLVKSGTDITVDSSGNVSVNDDSHNHVIDNVDGLQSALDGKAASNHTHSKSQITDFPTSLPASDVYSWAKAKSKPAYTKSEIGLGNVDNTADLDKCVKSVQDYNTTTSSPILIGYSGSGLTPSELSHIAGYVNLNGSIRIKDVNKDTLKSWLGLGSAAYTESSAYAPSNINYYDASMQRSANTILAAPNGSNGAATFRKLVENDLPKSYLPSSGGTMTGNIILPADDNMGIIPNSNNYGQIGSKDKKFYRMYATNFYGTTGDYTKLQIGEIHGSSGQTAHVKVTSYNSTQGEHYPSTTEVWANGTSSKKWYAVWSLAFNGASDKKLKTDIKDIDSVWADKFIDSLKPSTYKFKNNVYGKTHTGFIAQDVEESMLSLGMKRTDFAGLVKARKKTEEERKECNSIEEINYDPDNYEGDDENYDYSLRYDDFIAPLVAYCQNLKKKSLQQEEEIAQLKESIEELKEMITKAQV